MSVRLHFWVVRGILVDKQHTQALVDMEEKDELQGLGLVYTDPMSDSDIIVGEILYRYTDELDDDKAGIPAIILPDDIFLLETKLRLIADKLGIPPHINTYALTELS